MFNGFDTDPSMLRIGAMNMLLHGVEEPNIARQDSLSDDNQVRNAYSLILFRNNSILSLSSDRPTAIGCPP